MHTDSNFIIKEKYRTIFRTKKEATVRFSFEKGFNQKNIIDNAHLQKLFKIESKIENIEHYPFIIIGESVKCFFSPEIINIIKEPDDREEDLFLIATPVCFYFENFYGWIYTTPKEWDEQIETTGEKFPIIKTGAIYKMIIKPISSELGPQHKTELLIPKNEIIFNTEEQLIEFYSKIHNSNIHKSNISYLENWDMEFMVLSIGKPFRCKTNFDQLKTENKGGVEVQPIQIIGIDKEKIGWIPFTVSRIRYGLELIQE